MNWFDVLGRECVRCGSTELVFVHRKHGPSARERKIVSLDHYIWGKDLGEASLTTKLTSDGLELAEELWNMVPPDLRETTLATKESIFPLDPETIMKKVHREFPEYKKEYTEPDRE